MPIKCQKNVHLSFSKSSVMFSNVIFCLKSTDVHSYLYFCPGQAGSTYCWVLKDVDVPHLSAKTHKKNKLGNDLILLISCIIPLLKCDSFYSMDLHCCSKTNWNMSVSHTVAASCSFILMNIASDALMVLDASRQFLENMRNIYSCRFL